MNVNYKLDILTRWHKKYKLEYCKFTKNGNDQITSLFAFSTFIETCNYQSLNYIFSQVCLHT